MRRLLLLCRKDLALELRSREILALTISLGVLLSVVTSFGIGSSFLSPPIRSSLFPVFIWILFLFAATISLGRTLEYELADGALDSLLASAVPLPMLYVSKVIAASLFAFLAHLCCSGVLYGLMDTQIHQGLIAFLAISLLVILGYSALATLLVAISATSRLRGLLLPLILLPLVGPLLFSGIELSRVAFEQGSISLDSPWLSLLISLDVVYFLAGLNLYEHALRD